MKLCKAYEDFYVLDKIQFSKGYKEYETAYEELKEKLNLKREEINQGLWTLVIVTKGNK